MYYAILYNTMIKTGHNINRNGRGDMENPDLNLSGLVKKDAISGVSETFELMVSGMAFARAALILRGFVSDTGLIGKGIVSVALFLTPDKVNPFGLTISVVCSFS